MSYKEQFLKDLEYAYSEVGEVALWNGREIFISKVEDYDFETIDGDLYSVLVKSVEGLEEGQTVYIDGKNLKIHNFRFKDEMKLEYLIGVINNG
ncbi:hypothetical protein [Arcobacter aquimarinus]|uniref:hypothetical protein n=1 Tax=Arcobacter aquimarinus TaxID=1315211 RepID=UPI003BB127FC